ncbi:MAG: DUF5082 family protein [Oscillospiraceae bacterium]
MGREELESEKSRKQSEKAEHEREKAIIEEKLKRLRVSKSQIAMIKDNIGDLKKGVKEKEDQDETWKGYEYNWYHSFTSGTFRSDYDKYHSNVDDVLDDICNKITELENQSREEEGIIGWIASAINSLFNEIENLIN